MVTWLESRDARLIVNSKTHVILFLNDSDSLIKPLNKSYWYIQICVHAAADTESR